MFAKKCAKCMIQKSAEEFWRKRSASDGLQSQCKCCMSSYQAERYVTNIDVRSAKSRDYFSENRDRINEKSRKYFAENKARISAQRRIQRSENTVAIAAKQKEWASNNADRIRANRKARWEREKRGLEFSRKPYFLDYYRRIAQADPSHFARKTSARRACLLQAKPSWADDKKIAEFYRTAQGLSMLLGDWYHVDHIVPLKGKTVCGLHTEANLCVLLGSANMSKSNRHWPDQP